MIVVAAAALRTIVSAAEAHYPDESCGLLIGRRESDGPADGRIVVSEVREGANVAPEPRRERFEIDPRLRLQTMRALADGPETIVGHYHSHPDRPARPSRTDIERAYEPGLIWVITAVAAGRAIETAAFRIERGLVFRLELLVADAPA